MKDLFVIRDSLVNKISYYHLLLFFASLPFDRFYSQVVLISFTVHTLINIKELHLNSVNKSAIFLLSLPFILTFAGLFYTPNPSNALQEIDKQLAIFIFPVLLSLNGMEISRYQKSFALALALSCTISILYLYFDAIRIISVNGLPYSDIMSKSFMNHNFSSPIAIHATYLSMLASFSIIYFITEIIKTALITKRLVLSIPILVLILGIVQLNSKSVFVALFISILVAPFFLINGIRRLKVLFFIAILCLLTLTVIYQAAPFRKHFFTELSKDMTNFQTPELTDSRMARWNAASAVIGRSPVFGYGSGSEAAVLIEEYFSRKLYHSYLNNLNAHNQYLSFWIKFGLTGITIYLLTLAYGFRVALLHRNLLFFSFMLLISIVSLSENILDVNKGIFFYSSLFSLFTFSVKDQVVNLKINFAKQQPEQSLAS